MCEQKNGGVPLGQEMGAVTTGSQDGERKSTESHSISVSSSLLDPLLTSGITYLHFCVFGNKVCLVYLWC